MVFYDESGKAIITTKTRQEYQSSEPKTTTTTVPQIIQDAVKGITPYGTTLTRTPRTETKTSLKSKTGTSSPETTTTARRRRIAETQSGVAEKDIGSGVSPTTNILQETLQETATAKEVTVPKEVPQVIKDIISIGGITPYERGIIEQVSTKEPVVEKAKIETPSITSGTELRFSTLKDLGGYVEQYKQIDPNKTYILESEESISGSDLKLQLGSDLKTAFLDTTRIRPGLYVQADDKYYRVKSGEEARRVIKSLDIPEMIRDLGPTASKEYNTTLFKLESGDLTEKQAYEKMQSDFENRLTSGTSKSVAIDWMKKHGTFNYDGKNYTWSELIKKNPNLTLDRYNGEFVISQTPIDYSAWRREQYSGMNPIVAGIRRGTAKFLGGFANIDYIHAGLQGRTQDQQEMIDKWEYDTLKTVKDMGGSFSYFRNTDDATLKLYEPTAFSEIFIRVPAIQNVVLPYVGGTIFGSALTGGQLASNFLISHGARHTGKLIKYGLGAGAVALGAKGVADVGTDIYATHLRDPDEATRKMLTTGTQFASFGFGMKSGSDFTQAFAERASDLLSRPSDLPKDVGGFRRIEPELAKARRGELLKKYHPDKVTGKLAIEQKLSSKNLADTRFLNRQEALIRKGKIRTQQMLDAYKAYGSQPKVTRLQEFKSILQGRNRFVQPDVWFRIPKQEPVQLLGMGDYVAPKTEPITIKKGISLKSQGTELVPSSFDSGHWWGSLESDIGFRYPKMTLDAKVLESNVEPKTLEDWGLNVDAFKIRKTTTGIPEVSYGKVEPYKVFDSRGGLRTPTLKETQSYLSKFREAPVTKSKTHTVGTRLEDWGVLDTTGKKITSFDKHSTLRSGKDLKPALEKVPEETVKKFFTEKNRRAFQKWYTPETIKEYSRMGKYEYTIYKPRQFPKFKTLADVLKEDFKSSKDALKEKIEKVTKKDKVSKDTKYLEDVPASKRTLLDDVIRPTPKADGIYISGKTGKAYKYLDGVKYEEAGVTKDVIKWKKVSGEATTPSKGDIKITDSKYNVIRPPEGGRLYIDVNTGKITLQKKGKFYRVKESKTGQVSYQELKPAKVETGRRYDIERKLRRNLTEWEKMQAEPKDAWITTEEQLGSAKKIREKRFEPTKKETKKKPKYVEEEQYSYVEPYQPKSVSSGPEGTFSKMPQRRSGWSSPSLRELEEMEYGIDTHKHWGKVSPYQRYPKPDVFGAKDKLMSSLPRKLPSYFYGVGFGLIKPTESILVKPIRIEGELPITDSERDTFYGTIPDFRTDVVTDTTPVTDTIPKQSIDTGFKPVIIPDYTTDTIYDHEFNRIKEPKTIPPVEPEYDEPEKKLPIKRLKKEKYRLGYKERTYNVKDMWSLTKFKKPKYFSLAKRR